ncbi:MAG TPA: LacI family DNA-binding transcriptional regulator, partial [Orrella sp.]
MSILRIAELSGVSPATVSRVFNRPQQVSEATREHVMRIADHVGYRPNAAARALRTQRSRIIGVMLPTLRNPVFAECLEGIAQKALDQGFGIMPIASGYDQHQEAAAIATLLAANVDGLVLTVTDPKHCAPALDALAQKNVPYVLAYNQSPDHLCVGVNSQAEVTRAVQRLVKAGHERIAMLSGELAASDRAHARYQGYLAGMALAQLPSMPL